MNQIDSISNQLEYHFAECRLDPARRELRHRAELQQVAPRVLDLLIFLIERRSRVVRKDELMEQVWDGEILTDGVLAQAVSRARKAIGDVGKPPLIKTVHRTGYRFACDVEVTGGQSVPAAMPAHAEPTAGSQGSATAVPPSDALSPSTASSTAAYETRTLSSRPPTRLLPDAEQGQSAEVLQFTFFALNEEVSAWATALPVTYGAQRLALLLRLSWHLRQRDSTRALAMADEADALLSGFGNSEATRHRARLALVRGEVKWLSGQLHAATDLAKQAALTFSECADLAGVCDATLLQAAIAVDRDDPASRDACVLSSMEQAKTLGDNERYPLLQLQLALSEAQQNPANARTKWTLRIARWKTTCGPGVVATCHYVEATWAAYTGDRAERLRCAMAARDLYEAVGQQRDVVRETGNIGAMFANLFDNEAALRWMIEALTLSRAVAWPLNIGACLTQAAAIIGPMLMRPAEAVSLLDEADQHLASFPGSRVAIQALQYRGEVQFMLGNPTLALAAFERSGAQARARRLTHCEIDALVGQARALSSLGRSGEARNVALEALCLSEAHANDYCQYLVLETLAAIHRSHQELSHESVSEPSVVLHYLLRALNKQSVDNPSSAPSSLLAELAAEYARLGDYANAYAYQTRSQAMHAEAHSAEINSRAIAIRIHNDVEQARADSAHHRALAAAHAERAEALAQTNATLARMASIGQEITRHLEERAIFEALERHVRGLLDATTLAVFLLDSTGTMLELSFGVEAGTSLHDGFVTLDDPIDCIARCARECRELHIESADLARSSTNCMPPSQSALYAPMSIGNRVLGVLAVQSQHAGSYGERELLVLRSLGAYTAVALSNATAYHRLESARDALLLTRTELLDKRRELSRARRALKHSQPL